MVMEISKQLPTQPKAIVLSCGGGGLLMGVLEGIKKLNWYKTEIIVVETHGASSFNLMTKSGGKRARLERITSRATTLGYNVFNLQYRNSKFIRNIFLVR